ncbi:MAG: hypothetical protein Q4P28_04110 [Tissierellia bacterium]|nr:hypothetical protein [Tissierellia bacterium]
MQNYFESTRAADHIHKLFGFKEVHREDNIVHLLIKKEDYLRGNKPAK